jgi:hypothetical protein
MRIDSGRKLLADNVPPARWGADYIEAKELSALVAGAVATMGRKTLLF